MIEAALSVYEAMHPEYVKYITAGIAIAAALATVLPPPPASWSGKWYGSAYGGAYRGVQWAAMNFGHGRNANDPKALAQARAVINNAPAASVG